MRNFFESLRETLIQSNLPGIVGAVLVLLIGWLVALWLSGMAAAAALNCTAWCRQLPGSDPERNPEHVGKTTGKIVWWIVMILVLLGCMSLLQLDGAALPLREFMVVLARYIPNLAGALLLIIAARIIAAVVRAAIRKVAEKKAQSLEENDSWGREKVKTVELSADGAVWLIYLFFLPAILNALGIYGITAPLQAMFATALIYLPRVAAALLIVVVGFWAARVVRRAVTAMVQALKVDEAGAFFGFRKFSGHTFGNLCGNVAWVLVAIPVVIAALTALDIAVLSQSVSGFLNMLLFSAGNIIGAVLIFFGAFLIGKVAEKSVRSLSKSSGVDTLQEKLSVSSERFPEFTFSAAAGKIAGIAVWVLGLLAGCEILRFNEVSAVIRKFAVFGGNLILSFIILVFGAAMAQFTGRLIGDKIGKGLLWGIKAAIMIFTAALALTNLNIGNGVVQIIFAMVLGALCLAGGLAFGLGGRDFAASLLEQWRREK